MSMLGNGAIKDIEEGRTFKASKKVICLRKVLPSRLRGKSYLRDFEEGRTVYIRGRLYLQGRWYLRGRYNLCQQYDLPRSLEGTTFKASEIFPFIAYSEIVIVTGNPWNSAGFRLIDV
jgi:hypothetical protein